MDSTDLREQIRTMLAAGLKQRQIAVYLGIGQATVSDHKRALVAAGRLPASPSATAAGGDVVELVPAPRAAGRTRAEILLEHAELKASTLRAAACTFAEHIVGADEWVTDPHYREQVQAVAADAVCEAIEHLERIAGDLGVLEGLPRSASAGTRGVQ
jgi:transposase